MIKEEDTNTEELKEIPVITSEGEVSPEEDDDVNSPFRWYAVRIISGHENKVKLYLDSQIKTEKLEDKIRNVLIPLEKVFEVKNGKKKVKMKNFLPGYILIEVNIDDKIRSFISQAPSIINMVGSKSVKGKKLDLAPLRPAEVKRIKAILNDENQDDKIDFHLAPGDPVKVIGGPFNNFNGNVLEIYPEKMKVKVMVSIFGRKTPVDLNMTEVEREK